MLQGVNGRGVTTIDGGGGENRCLYLHHSNAVVDGFTIRNGHLSSSSYNGQGGGVLIDGEGLIQNCTVKDNSGGYGGGGGVCLNGGGAAVNCIIEGNINEYGGGGGIAISGSGRAENCEVRANTAYFASGGGMKLIDGGFADSCLIISNCAHYSDGSGGIYVGRGGLVQNCQVVTNNGGGVVCESEGVIRNSLIRKNDGGAVYLYGGSLHNCAVVQNTAAGGLGGLVCVNGGEVVNSIIYMNLSSPNANYTNVGTGWSYSHCCTFPEVPGVGNITNNPGFVDADNGDLRLGQDSPCIGAGLNEAWMTNAVDLDGHTRIDGEFVDLGPYEFIGSLHCRFVSSMSEGFEASSVIFTASVSGTNMYGLYYAWDVDGDGETDLEGPDLQIITNTYMVIGRDYTVSLTVSNEVGEMYTFTRTNAIRLGVRESYVSPDGPGIFPYTNWAMATPDMQAAVDVGVGGTVVFVTNGTYVLSNQVQVIRGITLRSVSGAGNTLIDGNFPVNVSRCFDISNADAVVEGFTITGGYADDARGGGGVLLAAGVLQNSILHDNKALSSGGGLRVTGNGAVRSCLVYNNEVLSGSGGGVFCDHGGFVQNCTITDNTVSNGMGGGVFGDQGGCIENSIVFGNHAPNGANYSGSSSGASYSYSCANPLPSGIGNITNDPGFVDTSERNYRLCASSLCLDAGKNEAWMADALDLDGTNRIVNGTVDIGAYELPVPTNSCVLTHLPSGNVSAPISALRLVFNWAMDQASFDPAVDVVSFSGPAGSIAISGSMWLAADVLELQFPAQSLPGVYELVIGPGILDRTGRELDQNGNGIAGEPNDCYTAIFSISGLYVTGHVPSGDQTNPVDQVVVSFSKPIADNKFTTNDVSITGPDGSIAIASGPIRITELEYCIGFPLQENPGDYHVYVGPEIESTDGCLLDQDGDGISGEPMDDRYDAGFTIIDVVGPYLVSYCPVRTNQLIDHVDLIFNEAIDLSSFELSDVSMTDASAAGIEVTTITNLDDHSFRVSFPVQTVEGSYQISIGPDIRDLRGNLMNQDRDGLNGEAFDDRAAVEIVIDRISPVVVGSSVTGTQNMAVAAVDITFSEDMNAGSFSTNAILVIGPHGTNKVSSITRISGHTYRIGFSGCEEDGTYEIRVASSVTDVAGNALDQDGDGNPGQITDDYICRCVQELPDLVVSGVTGPAEALAGQDVNIQWSVANQGGGKAEGRWRDSVYLSSTASFSPSGTNAFLGYLDFTQSLYPTASYTRVLSVTLTNVTSGRWWIVVVSDSENELDERSGSTNNTCVSASTLSLVSRPYPDLRVSDVVAPAVLSAGEKTTISWKVRNAGTAATSASYWYDQVYLSVDTNFDVYSDQALTPRSRNPDVLAPGESYSQTADVEIPADTIHTSFYVFVYADVSDLVEEFDCEGNNVALGLVAVNVITPPPAMLSVVAINAPTQSFAGESITISWAVKNTGGTTMQLSTDHAIVLSKDEILDFTDGDVGLAWHVGSWAGTFAPGTSYTAQTMVDIPNTVCGNYYLIPLPDPPQSTGLDKEVMAAPINIVIRNPADIEPVYLDASSNGWSGQKISVSWDVLNRGHGSSVVQNWVDAVYLSSNDVIDVADVQLGTILHNGVLASNESYSVELAEFELPADVDGEFYLLLWTDAHNELFETNELNNTMATESRISVHQHKQDLLVSTVQAPAEAQEGRAVRIEWSVQNVGTEVTVGSGWSDAVYLSTNSLLDPTNSSLLGVFRHTENLGADASYSNHAAMVLPSKIEGLYYLYVMCDANAEVYEPGGETNNVYRLNPPITISNPAPDLVPVSLATPSNAVAGQVIAVHWAVSNVGTAVASAPWTDTVYLSVDEYYDPTSDVIVAVFTHTNDVPLGSGYEADLSSTTVTLPDGIEGEFHLFFVADSGDAVYEKNFEGNNVLLLPNTVAIADYTPDLQVYGAEIPSNGIAGELISVQWAVVNGGVEAATGSWYDAVYLSEDASFNANMDTLFGLYDHSGPLAVGETSSVPSQATWMRLPGRMEGDYHVFIVADAGDGVLERSGETNNVYMVSSPIHIADQAADLQVDTVSAPSEALAGSAIPVSWVVVNRGPRATSETYWQDGVYISQDDVFDTASDIELGVIQHTGALNPDDEYAASGMFTLRQDIEGPYHVYVVADLRRQVYEHTNEVNNTDSSPVLLNVMGARVDLQVASFSGPLSAYAGDGISLSWTVRNLGLDPTPVASWTDGIYLSSDNQLDGEDTALLARPHNGVLTAYGSYVESRSVSLPGDVEGQCFLIVKTDSSSFNDVFEYEAETNNTAVVPVSIELTPPADLQVVSISAPGSAWSGQSLPVQWTVSNEGASDAISAIGRWYDSIYLSRDIYLDKNSDTKLGSFVHQSGLEAGQSYDGNESLRLPGGISGPFYVIVFADSTDQVFERGLENNNEGVALSVVQVNLTPPADLIVTNIITPTNAVVYGDVSEIMFYTANVGSEPASGEWCDTLYLSSDEVWDPYDPRIARVLHTGDVAAASNYVSSIATNIPAVLPGDYFIIAHADTFDDVRETIETNNVMVSTGLVAIVGREMTLGVPVTNTVAGGEAMYYQINLSEGQDLLVGLSDKGFECAELYVSYAQLPTRSEFDFKGETNEDGRLLVRIPGTRAGTYYVLVSGGHCSSVASQFVLLASLAEYSISGLSIEEAGNTGNATVTIDGYHFSSGVAVRLEDSAQHVVATGTTCFENSGRIYATFDLTGVASGTYTLVLENPDGSFTSTGFHVAEGRGGDLFARLVMPSLVRLNRPTTLTIEYGNNGDADIPSPLLAVSADEGVGLRLFTAENFSSDPVQVMGLADGHPAGVLPPHSAYRIKMEYQMSVQNWQQFYLKIITATNQEPMDWDNIEPQLRPSGLESEEWDIVWSNLTTRLGLTWGSYAAVLGIDATRLAMRGQRTYDVRDLFSFEMNIAYGGGVGAIVGRVVDSDTGQLIEDVLVLALSNSGATKARATTTAGGWFVLDGLYPGTYFLDVPSCFLNSNVKVMLSVDEDVLDENIYVIRAAEISGYVLSSNGSLLEDALVYAWTGETTDPFVARTDDHGFYCISRLAAGLYSIAVSDEKYSRTQERQVQLQTAESRSGVDFVLAEGGVVTGTVLNVSTRSPVSGSAVIAVAEDGEVVSALANSQGEYSIGQLKAGFWSVSARANQFLSSTPVIFNMKEGDNVNWTCELLPACTVSGMILDCNNLPITNATILVAGGDDDNQYLTTDSEGRYVISGLPFGDYEITVTASGFVSSSIQLTNLIAGGTVSNPVLRLTEGVRVVGLVTEAGNTVPVVDADVYLEANSGTWSYSRSEADGYFDAEYLSPDIYCLHVVAAKYAPVQRIIDVSVTGVLHRYSVSLPFEGSVSGAVVDSDGLSSVTNAWVYLATTQGVVLVSQRTDSDGSFFLQHLQAGAYVLSAYAEDRSFQSHKVSVSGSVTTICNFLAAKNKIIGGVKEANTGNPAGGARVLAVPSSDGLTGNVYLNANVDTQGEFVIEGLSDGLWLIIAEAPGLSREMQTVLVESNSTNRVDFNLASPLTLTGIVLRISTGEKLADASVLLLDERYSFWDPGNALLTDQNGNFAFSNLVAGRYTLVTDSDSSALDIQNISITSSTTITISVEDRGVKFTGSVIDAETGLPVAKALASLSYNGRLMRTALSDNTGSFHLDGLATAEYSIEIDYNGTGMQFPLAVQCDSDALFTLPVSSPLICLDDSSAHDLTSRTRYDASVISSAYGGIPVRCVYEPGYELLDLPSETYEWAGLDYDTYEREFKERNKIEEPQCDDLGLDGEYNSLVAMRDSLITPAYYAQRTVANIQQRADYLESTRYDRRNNAAFLWVAKLLCRPLAIALNVRDVLMDGATAAQTVANMKESAQLLDIYAHQTMVDAEWSFAKTLTQLRDFCEPGTKQLLTAVGWIFGGFDLLDACIKADDEYFRDIQRLVNDLGLCNDNTKRFWPQWREYLAILRSYNEHNRICYHMKLEWSLGGKAEAYPSRSPGAKSPGVYFEDTMVQVWAFANDGYRFDHWEGSIMWPFRKTPFFTTRIYQDCSFYANFEKDDDDDTPDPGPGEPSGGSSAPSSQDPNDKLVDVGVGEARFVTEEQTLGYTIRFENTSNATASAQLITITDPLNTNLDWNTFELGDIQFGHRTVTVPAGLTFYSTRIDLRPDGNDLLVDIEASFDRDTGVAGWLFTAIDPETGEFTEDPLDGFLPPNNTNHDGEGSVKFSVKPKDGLPTGTVIPNIATIVFDWNEPIDTPLVYVTMDAGGPSSWVKLLPAESTPRFVVSWEGEDDAGGSGIASYDVYVSKNGLPYSCWLNETESLSAQFEGETNSTYAFYTVARDQVERIEAAPSVPDASTKVIAVTSEEDADNDGMPDSWEREHFGTILRGTAYSDSDGDGASDVEEYLADTDPTNRRSVFAVSRIVPVGTYYNDGIYTNYAGIFTNEWLGVYTNEIDEIWTDRLLKVEGFVVEWSGSTNKRYRLGRVTNLVGAYSDILGSNIPGISPVNSYTDKVNNGSGPYFYHIQLDP